MTDLRTERARIRRALRVKVADYLDGCPPFPADNRLWTFAQKEAARLTRQLRTGKGFV